MGISRHTIIVNASKRRVNPLPALAHGTSTKRTPCSGQSTLGTRASSSLRYWKKSKCLHLFTTVSWVGPQVPHSGHANRWPGLKSSFRRSSGGAPSKLQLFTLHPSPSPSAIVKSTSGVIDPHSYPTTHPLLNPSTHSIQRGARNYNN